MIYKLAERDGGAIESDIERLSEVLLAEVGGEYQEKINELLQFCIYAVPEKLTVYSCLVGVMNARNGGFGNAFLQSLWTHLHRCLSRGQFTHVQRIVRFICDLLNSKVISAESLLNLLGTLINTACGDSETSSERRSDFFVYIVLSSLPWCGRALHECRPQALTQLLNTIYEYVDASSGKRKKLHLPLLQVWTAPEPHLQEDYLDCLVEQIRNLVADDWNESQIPRPYHSFDSVLCEADTHSFPQLELLTADEEESNELVYPLPKVVFRMFDYTDVPDNHILPGSHSIERYLIEDQLNNLINTYYLERKVCALYLVNHKALPNMPLDYIIVEVIFGQLFTLPNPPHIELFYGALLIELCKMNPSKLPQILAQATELIFDRLPTMKAICIERYINWFSYNLSNFQLRWSWNYWSYVFAEGDKSAETECARAMIDAAEHPIAVASINTGIAETKEPTGVDGSRPVDDVSDLLGEPQISNYDREVKLHFIREVMRKLIRFSYEAALLQTTPTCFHQLVPKRMKPCYKYGSPRQMDGGMRGAEEGGIGAEVNVELKKKVASAIDDEGAEVFVDQNDEYGNTVVVIRKGDAQLAQRRRHSAACSMAARLRSAMEEKTTSALDIQKILQAVTSNNADLDRSTVLDVFFSTILFMGSKTFSHTYAALVRYHTVLRSLIINDEEERQLVLLNCAYSVWCRHQQMLVFLVEKLLRAQIVDCISIGTWIFSKEMLDQLMSMYVWEILHNTIQFECRKLSAFEAQRRGSKGSRLQEDRDDQRSIVKNLFLTVLQRMVAVISDYIDSFEQQQRLGSRPSGEDPFHTTWYKWMTERMQAILLCFHDEIRPFKGALQAIVFTPDVQFTVLDLFQRFCSIHC